MKRSTILRTGALGALCAVAGGAAGIAGTSASSSRTLSAPTFPHRHGFLFFGAGPRADAAGPPVHSDTVVPNKSGGFDTITMDRGSFSSLSGDQLTITEGTKTATYKTVTLTIAPGATIRRNGAQAQLADLKAGAEVTVLHSPKATVVMARDAEHQLAFKPGLQRHGDGPPGDGLPGDGHGAPVPPGAPQAPQEGSSGGA
jgi:hypothetical protein